jgi:pimeloyl-ACP methyl ester carboxylesterase
MNDAAPTLAPASPDAANLPAPVSGQEREIDSFAGRLVYYTAAPELAADATPLLLIHSINAAGSAYEIGPLYEYYRKFRPVYAIELPGFGHSLRGDRQYTIRMMTDAIHAVVAEIARIHGDSPIDAAALSLSCEFLARAASETPQAFRSLALISPTGFDSRPTKWIRGSRGKPWLRAIFNVPLWSERFFGLLTTKPVIGWFLKKTWGAETYDRGLLDYDYLTTHQPGAQYAPYYFVSGFLFSQDILRIYQELTMPVWMSHGTRGDFVDYRAKDTVEGKPNWTITEFLTGAMPHFEVLDRFVKTYDGFLAGAAAGVAAPDMIAPIE